MTSFFLIFELRHDQLKGGIAYGPLSNPSAIDLCAASVIWRPSQATYFEGSLQDSTPTLPQLLLKLKLYGLPTPQQADKCLFMNPDNIIDLETQSTPNH